MINHKKMLLVGIGALGGVFSFKLISKGYDCKLISKNEEICNYINVHGIRLNDDVIKATCQLQLPENEQFDYIFLMVKTTAIRESGQEIISKSLLKENGIIVTVQNGDVYDEIADLFPNKIATCIIVWGASMLGPGYYTITSNGKTFVGDRTNTLDLHELQLILSNVSPSGVELSNNILGVVWSKLATSCANNALSGITGLRLGEFTKIKKAQLVFLEAYSETIEVAEKMQIKLEKLVADPYRLYLPKNSNFVKRKIKRYYITIVGKRFGLVKLSTLQDIERGRPTEIDYLNGYVSKKGKEVNFPTPINDKLRNLIKLIEKGDLNPTVENLSEIQL